MNKRIPLYLDTSAPGWMVQSDFDGTISLLDVSWRTPGSAARSARANA
jgi:hypothetical protein